MRPAGFALVLGSVFVAAIASGCGASGGDARDQALLASVMRGVKTDLVSVQIEPVSRVWGNLHSRGLGLVVKSAETTTPGKIIDDWYGALIASGYNAQCAAKADHCLAWYFGVTGGNRLGGRYARQPFAVRRTLARKIRAAFASAGLRVTSVSFERPYALAPVITVRTRHPQRAVYAIRDADAAMPCCRTAGTLVRMLDGRGRVFLVEAGAWSGSAGWVRQGLRVPGVDMGATGSQGPTGSKGPSGPLGPYGP